VPAKKWSTSARRWDEEYLPIGQSWRCKWPRLIPLSGYPPEICEAAAYFLWVEARIGVADKKAGRSFLRGSGDSPSEIQHVYPAICCNAPAQFST
jgi:hypothetical protein